MKILIALIAAILALPATGQQIVKPFNGGTGISQANTKTITLGGPLVTNASTTISSAWATFLSTSSSANLISVMTDETGSGSLVFGTSPTLGGTVVFSNQAGFTGSRTFTSTTDTVLDFAATITNNTGIVISNIKMRNTFNGNGNAPTAFDMTPTFAPSASIADARAMQSSAIFSPASTITITNAVASYVAPTYGATAGAVTNGFGLYVATPFLFGSLKPATSYGQYIENQGIAGVTNTYGLYIAAQSGSTNPYALITAGAGNVGFGTATPAAKVAINGGIHVGGDSDPGDNNALVDGTLVATGLTSANGGLARGIVTETTATRTVATTDTHIIANRAGTITLTLPTASSFNGRELYVRTIQAQTVVSNASNVVPMVGGAAGTAILAATAGKWALLVSDGTNWQIMAGN